MRRGVEKERVSDRGWRRKGRERWGEVEKERGRDVGWRRNRGGRGAAAILELQQDSQLHNF
jgi:hypothetical protein